MEIKLDRLDPVFKEHEPVEELRFLYFSDPHLTHAKPISRKDDYPYSMLAKIDALAQISNSYKFDFVLIGGDVFHIKSQPDLYLVDVIHTFSKFQCPVYTVLGNHDMMYDRPDTIRKTPIGILLSSGVVKRLGELKFKVKNFNILIKGFDFTPNLILPTQQYLDTSINIAVLHAFMPSVSTFYPAEECLKLENIQKSMWNYLFIGHDHMNYPVDNRLGPTIVRPGALSRGTQNVSNRHRQVQICTFQITDKVDLQTHELPVAPSEEIFSEQKIDREDVSKKINEFVKSFRDKNVETSKVEQTLQTICGEEKEVFQTCKKYLVSHGII